MNISTLRNVSELNKSMVIFDKHIQKYYEQFISKNRIARAKDWRPIRMCTRDMILALIVLRKHIKNNIILVDSCIVDNIPQFEKHYSTMVALSSIFSEAFKCSSNMEVHFTRNVCGGGIPQCIYDFADSINLKLRFAYRGILLPSEVRLLYLAITELSEQARSVAIELHKSGFITVERICFMVHSGMWSKDEMESILLGHPNPASLLLGEFAPHHRISFLFDMMYARIAYVGGVLDRIIKTRDTDENAFVEEFVNDRDVTISFDASHAIKIYRCADEDILLSWQIWERDFPITIPKGDFVFARLLPRSISELSAMMQGDMKCYISAVMSFAKNMENKFNCKSHHFFVVPFEFCNLNSATQNALWKLADENNIGIMIYPQTTQFLDGEIMHKYNASRRLRR